MAVQEQVVLITGAHGQVGQAVVRELDGKARLALFDRSVHAGLGDVLPHRVSRGGIDLRDEAALASAVSSVRTTLGPIRALVHTVGGYFGGSAVLAQTQDQLREMLEMNYLSAASVVRAVLPDMLAAGEGRIILFGSAHSLRGHAGAAGYGAAKAALLRFAEALADEVTPQGVSVRVLLPTTIDSPANRAAMPDASFSDWVTPQQIAQTVAFLLDPASDGIRFAAIPMGR